MHHTFTPPNPLTVKYSSITVSQLLPGIPVELTNYGDSYNSAPIFGMLARNIKQLIHHTMSPELTRFVNSYSYDYDALIVRVYS